MKYTNEYTIKEAYRYLQNAKETLSKSPIEYERYTDRKYVREAAGIAYLAAYVAIDSYLSQKGVFPTKKLPKSIDGYWELIRQYIPLNGKLYAALNIIFENLHVDAYYRGQTNVALVKAGFENVKKIIIMIEELHQKNEPFSVLQEATVKYRKKKNND